MNNGKNTPQVIISYNGNATLAQALSSDGRNVKVRLNDQTEVDSPENVKFIFQTGPSSLFHRSARIVGQVGRELVLEFSKPLSEGVLAGLFG
ncbi:MAG TPA: hypothetical protein EYO33_00130 [Phycisphaerales bacterium]|nr:hypothetical protein [Phycisphaerales bacterium]